MLSIEGWCGLVSVYSVCCVFWVWFLVFLCFEIGFLSFFIWKWVKKCDN
jgi:hypothetical protein